ncbi:MAG: response regulator [Verrucomicrobiota bacterium]|nr:response regulator [Verrucomicrobiota bacterium]
MTDTIRLSAAGNSLFDELLQSVYEAIFITSVHGEIVIANSRAEELFLFGNTGPIGRNISDLISGFSDEILQNVIGSLQEQKHVLLDAACVRRDGATFSGEIAAHRIHMGPEPQLCFSIRDVTARAEAEAKLERAREELIRAEKIKARMETITTLAHEINNPLQMLMSMVEADGNVRYAAPLNRIFAVMQELRLQEELKTLKYAGTAQRYEIPDANVAPSQGRSLLIVDNEVTLRRFFQSIIGAKLQNLRIDTAADGREAVAAFRAKHHAVIIMDIAMPIMDGEQAFHEIKKVCKQNKWEMPAVIFCTGYTPPASIREAVQNEQLHCYLPKPVTGDVLVSTVKNRLEFYELSHEKAK